MPAPRTLAARTGLTMLAALGLAAAAPQFARAQTVTLQSGDGLTVSGAGTVGKYGANTYLPGQNTTNAYTDTGNGVAIAILTNDNSTFTLANGGTLTDTNSGYALFDNSSATVTITGGTLTGGQQGIGLHTNGTGNVVISGGTLTAGPGGRGLDAASSDVVTITGGIFSAGAGGYGIVVGFGTVNLFSRGDTPFLINGVPMNNMSLGKYTSTTSTITGTLLNGDTLNTTFVNFGTINLNPGVAAPEPSQTAALGLGVSGLAGLVLKARRRTRCIALTAHFAAK